MKARTNALIAGLTFAAGLTGYAQESRGVIQIDPGATDTVITVADPGSETPGDVPADREKTVIKRLQELKSHIDQGAGAYGETSDPALDDVVRWAVAEAGTTAVERIFPSGSGDGTFLGVSVTPVSPELSGQLALDTNTGLVVNHLEKDGPAEKAGLQKGDVLAKLDDQILIHPQQLSVLVGNKKEGDTVKLTFLRKGQSQEVSAVLTKREKSAEVKGSYRIGDTDVIIDAAGGRPIRTYMKHFGPRFGAAGAPGAPGAPGVPFQPAQPQVAPLADHPELEKKLEKIEAALEELRKSIEK